MVRRKKMDKTTKTTLIVLIIVVIFIIGISVGFFLPKNSAPIVSSSETQRAPQSPFASPLISAIFASGKLSSVSGSTVYIASGASTLAVSATSTTKIIAYVQSPKNSKGIVSVTPETISLSDLKAGDYLTINFKVSASGQMIATSINRVSLPNVQ